MDLCLCKVIVRKEICAEEQLYRFLDDLWRNAVIDPA